MSSFLAEPIGWSRAAVSGADDANDGVSLSFDGEEYSGASVEELVDGPLAARGYKPAAGCRKYRQRGGNEEPGVEGAGAEGEAQTEAEEAEQAEAALLAAVEAGCGADGEAWLGWYKKVAHNARRAIASAEAFGNTMGSSVMELMG